jgi:RNA polymerase sigma factor (sigma-70 family)
VGWSRCPGPMSRGALTRERDVREAYATHEVLIDLGRARAVSDGGVEPSVEPLEQSLLAWQVEEAMRRIGEQYRQVLVETYYRGRPYAEVAIELGVPEGTVKNSAYNGLRALKVALEELAFESRAR